MRTRLVVAVIIALGVPAALCGQRRQGPIAREALQAQIVQRFVQNYRMQAGLTDDQTQRFTALLERSFRDRREIESHLRDLFIALEGQLRPGVAASPDSLTVLLTEIRATRDRQVNLLHEYQDGFAEFLSPVQQGQLVLSLERLQRQIEGILRRQPPNGSMRRD